MLLWDQWKKGFEAWESRTAEVFEQLLKRPAVLEPMGGMLSATMKLKAQSDKAMATWWAVMGLPTRRDQERTLHSLNQLQSRLIDLEEKLASLESKRS